jgi:hypothetical protein
VNHRGTKREPAQEAFDAVGLGRAGASLRRLPGTSAAMAAGKGSPHHARPAPRIAVLGQNIAVKGLENLLGKVQQGEQVAPGDLSRPLDTSVKVERLARGESTDIQEPVGPGGGPPKVDQTEYIVAVRRALGFKE